MNQFKKIAQNLIVFIGILLLITSCGEKGDNGITGSSGDSDNNGINNHGGEVSRITITARNFILTYGDMETVSNTITYYDTNIPLSAIDFKVLEESSPAMGTFDNTPSSANYGTYTINNIGFAKIAYVVKGHSSLSNTFKITVNPKDISQTRNFSVDSIPDIRPTQTVNNLNITGLVGSDKITDPALFQVSIKQGGTVVDDKVVAIPKSIRTSGVVKNAISIQTTDALEESYQLVIKGLSNYSGEQIFNFNVNPNALEVIKGEVTYTASVSGTPTYGDAPFIFSHNATLTSSLNSQFTPTYALSINGGGTIPPGIEIDTSTGLVQVFENVFPIDVNLNVTISATNHQNRVIVNAIHLVIAKKVLTLTPNPATTINLVREVGKTTISTSDDLVGTDKFTDNFTAEVTVEGVFQTPTTDKTGIEITTGDRLTKYTPSKVVVKANQDSPYAGLATYTFNVIRKKRFVLSWSNLTIGYNYTNTMTAGLTSPIKDSLGEEISVDKLDFRIVSLPPVLGDKVTINDGTGSIEYSTGIPVGNYSFSISVSAKIDGGLIVAEYEKTPIQANLVVERRAAVFSPDLATLYLLQGNKKTVTFGLLPGENVADHFVYSPANPTKVSIAPNSDKTGYEITAGKENGIEEITFSPKTGSQYFGVKKYVVDVADRKHFILSWPELQVTNDYPASFTAALTNKIKDVFGDPINVADLKFVLETENKTDAPPDGTTISDTGLIIYPLGLTPGVYNFKVWVSPKPSSRIADTHGKKSFPVRLTIKEIIKENANRLTAPSSIAMLHIAGVSNVVIGNFVSRTSISNFNVEIYKGSGTSAPNETAKFDIAIVNATTFTVKVKPTSLSTFGAKDYEIRLTPKSGDLYYIAGTPKVIPIDSINALISGELKFNVYSAISHGIAIERGLGGYIKIDLDSIIGGPKSYDAYNYKVVYLGGPKGIGPWDPVSGRVDIAGNSKYGAGEFSVVVTAKDPSFKGSLSNNFYVYAMPRWTRSVYKGVGIFTVQKNGKLQLDCRIKLACGFFSRVDEISSMSFKMGPGYGALGIVTNDVYPTRLNLYPPDVIQYGIFVTLGYLQAMIAGDWDSTTLGRFPNNEKIGSINIVNGSDITFTGNGSVKSYTITGLNLAKQYPIFILDNNTLITEIEFSDDGLVRHFTGLSYGEITRLLLESDMNYTPTGLKLNGVTPTGNVTYALKEGSDPDVSIVDPTTGKIRIAQNFYKNLGTYSFTIIVSGENAKTTEFTFSYTVTKRPLTITPASTSYNLAVNQEIDINVAGFILGDTIDNEMEAKVISGSGVSITPKADKRGYKITANKPNLGSEIYVRAKANSTKYSGSNHYVVFVKDGNNPGYTGLQYNETTNFAYGSAVEATVIPNSLSATNGIFRSENVRYAKFSGPTDVSVGRDGTITVPANNKRKGNSSFTVEVEVSDSTGEIGRVIFPIVFKIETIDANTLTVLGKTISIVGRVLTNTITNLAGITDGNLATYFNIEATTGITATIIEGNNIKIETTGATPDKNYTLTLTPTTKGNDYYVGTKVFQLKLKDENFLKVLNAKLLNVRTDDDAWYPTRTDTVTPMHDFINYFLNSLIYYDEFNYLKEHWSYYIVEIQIAHVYYTYSYPHAKAEIDIERDLPFSIQTDSYYTDRIGESQFSYTHKAIISEYNKENQTIKHSGFLYRNGIYISNGHTGIKFSVIPK